MIFFIINYMLYSLITLPKAIGFLIKQLFSLTSDFYRLLISWPHPDPDPHNCSLIRWFSSVMPNGVSNKTPDFALLDFLQLIWRWGNWDHVKYYLITTICLSLDLNILWQIFRTKTITSVKNLLFKVHLFHLYQPSILHWFITQHYLMILCNLLDKYLAHMHAKHKYNILLSPFNCFPEKKNWLRF